MDLWDEFEKTLEVSLQMEGDRTLTTGKLIKLMQRAKRTAQAHETKREIEEAAMKADDSLWR